MSLSNAVAGVKAAQAGLDVTSNNLANAETTGFKSGTQRFADIYSRGTSGAGLGVRTAGIERNFSQGESETTGNPLDLAVQGDGYFMTNNNGVTQYTRDGRFTLDPDTGQLVNAKGNQVLGYPGNNTAGGQLEALTVNQSTQPGQASANIDLSANLFSNGEAPTQPFDAADADTYNSSTSVTAYDSLGNANDVQLYFRRADTGGTAGNPANWDVYAKPFNSTGDSAGDAQQITSLQFNSDGTLAGGQAGTLNVDWGNGSAPSNLQFDLGGTTLSSRQFAVNNTTNDGYRPGNYQGVRVENNGEIRAQYSNGEESTVGQVALGTFVNDQGLDPISGNGFIATNASGQPAVNLPGNGQAGRVSSGELEKSNVDLSEKLVSLITNQQAYQANTKSISTEKQNVSRLLQV